MWRSGTPWGCFIFWSFADFRSFWFQIVETANRLKFWCSACAVIQCLCLYNCIVLCEYSTEILFYNLLIINLVSNATLMTNINRYTATSGFLDHKFWTFYTDFTWSATDSVFFSNSEGLAQSWKTGRIFVFLFNLYTRCYFYNRLKFLNF